MGLSKLIPRISFTLFDTQGNTTTFFVDFKHHDIHFIANLNNFGWMNVFVGVIHFRNVNQTFNTFSNLGKATIVC